MYQLKRYNNLLEVYKQMLENIRLNKKGNIFIYKKYNNKILFSILFFIFIICFSFILNHYDINTFEELLVKLTALNIMITCIIICVLFLLLYKIVFLLNKRKMLKFNINKKIIEKNHKEYSIENRYVCIKELEDDESSNIFFLVLDSNIEDDEEIKVVKSTDYEKICITADYIATIIGSKVVKKKYKGSYSILDFSW